MYAILFLVLCVAVTECPELFNAERKKKFLLTEAKKAKIPR